MSKPSDQRAKTQLYIGLLLTLSVLVTGCDGGIFGTGDGGGKETMIMTPETSGAPATDPEHPETNLDTSGDSEGATPFDNNENQTNRTDALLRLINASDDSDLELVFINNNMVEDPLIPLPGLSATDGTSSYLSLATTANSVRVYAATDALDGSLDSPLAEISPLIVAPGSVTTLIARGSDDEVASTFQLLPLKTRIRSTDNTVLVRVIHAALISSATRTIDVTLSTNDASGAITNVVTALQYSEENSDYTGVGAGAYSIDVSDGNGETIAALNDITLTAGEAVTLVVQNNHRNAGSLPAAIRIIRDSVLDDAPLQP